MKESTFILVLSTVIVVGALEDNIAASMVDQLRYDFIKLEQQQWDSVLNNMENGSSEEDKFQDLLAEFTKFDDKVQQLELHETTYRMEYMDDFWDWRFIQADLQMIHSLYRNFRSILQNRQVETRRLHTLEKDCNDFAESVMSPENHVEYSLINMNNMIVKGRIFSADKEKTRIEAGNATQSSQQVLYNLYNTLALIELKGYTMIQFSHMLRQLVNRGNLLREAQHFRQRYQARTNETIGIVREAMSLATKDLYRCDPKNHVEGETYVKVTRLLQGIIQNEVDLNSEGTCQGSCSEYNYVAKTYKNMKCDPQQPNNCFHQTPCNGKILHCKFVDSDMSICPAANLLSGRRYEYIRYDNGRVLGRNEKCASRTRDVSSRWRWLFFQCSQCFCLCDAEGSLSDRYFNMKPTFSNMNDNRVVTGLRFVKKNRIIHLQLQEGKLLPRGNIDPKTVRWIPVDDYKITDYKVYSGQEYHTMRWNKRAMDLDDIVVDKGYLVTGVRFREVGLNLNLQIYQTKFDFETGELIDPEWYSDWRDNSKTTLSPQNPRTQVKLINPDVPTRCPSASVPDSSHNQYIEFTNTDMDRDAAQTTVPFIDAQPVESSIPVPLAGVGIFHKGQRNCGGFVAPKIITYDFSKHLKAAFP